MGIPLFYFNWVGLGGRRAWLAVYLNFEMSHLPSFWRLLWYLSPQGIHYFYFSKEQSWRTLAFLIKMCLFCASSAYLSDHFKPHLWYNTEELDNMFISSRLSIVLQSITYQVLEDQQWALQHFLGWCFS